ncbi:Panacea domain-containing protein [Lelliottia wanjuensis]|uniref:Panacea domain-containing protein n=1 Tax=Lelliottia wanjuensis TaxID=3050585 RepID=UPI00254AD8C3|nr:type II toxin-antitoxin system antitoxin SocA domain-containing protein [Lelliottia sp. V104_15]MDK9607089.1 DUF4065 domain-containing protein [Lelliottia sp. V104_15]
MAYSAVAVANAFIERQQKGVLTDLTPMKLQKLMFYAQSWHLYLKNNEPLFDDFFSKWKHGPVIPSLYHEFKEYVADPIKSKARVAIPSGTAVPIVPDTDKETHAFIDKIIEVYGGYSGRQLSYMTHMPGTAWDLTPAAGDAISNQLMAQCIGNQIGG